MGLPARLHQYKVHGAVLDCMQQAALQLLLLVLVQTVLIMQLQFPCRRVCTQQRSTARGSFLTLVTIKQHTPWAACWLLLVKLDLLWDPLRLLLPAVRVWLVSRSGSARWSELPHSTGSLLLWQQQEKDDATLPDLMP